MAPAPAKPAIAPCAEPGADAIARARGRLIVALDVPNVEQARVLAQSLGDEVEFYKVGLGLQLGGGETFARELKAGGKRVFLDYKYYDIRETVRNAVARAAEMGVDFLTVHGVSEILKGAVEGRGGSAMKILCVTVLTSMDAEDIQEMGYSPAVSVAELVVNRARKALEIGVDGVVASALEASQIKTATTGKLMVVSPGVRPLGSSKDDQKRIATPGEAMKAGADYLVVGRPITGAANPRDAARAIILEMAQAMNP